MDHDVKAWASSIFSSRSLDMTMSILFLTTRQLTVNTFRLLAEPTSSMPPLRYMKFSVSPFSTTAENLLSENFIISSSLFYRNVL